MSSTKSRTRRWFHYHVDTFSAPLDPGTTTSFLGSFTTSETRTVGPNIPGWKTVIRSGGNATTYLAGSRQRVSMESGFSQLVTNWIAGGSTAKFYPRVSTSSGNLLVPTMDPSGYVTGPVSARANNQALSRFISDATEAQRQLQAGVVLGEFGKTVRFISDTAREIRSGLFRHLFSLRKAKKGFKTASNNRKKKFLSQKWLEFQYAVKPLINDVQQSAEYLAESMNRTVSERKFIKGQGYSKDTSSVIEQDSVGLANAPVLNFDWLTDQESFVRYYGVVRIAHTEAGSAFERAGLTWHEFAPTIWELIPYSFLIDYFTNVSEIVAAASYSQCNFAWVTKGTKLRCSVYAGHFRPKYPSFPPGEFTQESGYTSPGSARRDFEQIVRLPYEGSLIPTLEFQIPTSIAKWINIAALVNVHRSIVPF
jgi:hypothetical protein